MTYKSRAGSLMESMGAAFNTENRVARTSLYETAAPVQEALDFATNAEMVDYLQKNLPASLADQGVLTVKEGKSFGGGNDITVKFVSRDYLDNPRANKIEHNAFYRLIFIMHQSPETPNTNDKLRFDVVAGVTRAHKEKGLKAPRLLDQRSFRAAADKLIAWFKKNEKLLLDWPREAASNEAMRGAEGREVIGSAEIKHVGRLLLQVPVYAGDTDTDLLDRAREHAKFVDAETKDRLTSGRIEIRRHALGEGEGEAEAVSERLVDLAKIDLDDYASGVANALRALEANRFNVKYDEATGKGTAMYKGLKVNFEAGNENLTVSLPTLFFKEAPEMGARAIRDVLEVASDLGGALRESEAVSEERVGRFYPTAPELTRQAFYTTMMEHIYKINVASDEGENGIDKAALVRAMANADKALTDWIQSERKGMATALDSAEQLAYEAELAEIESSLLFLRSGRGVTWEGMRDVIRTAIGLYGF